MTEPSVQQTATADNVRTVETFLDALADDDLDTAAAALAEDVVYQNVGLPTIYGRSATIGVFRRMAGRAAFDVKIHRVAAEGAAVLTERTDALTFGPLRLQFWVCGVFEVHNGRITLWRDYFDFFDMFKATLRAVAATVFPALRPSW
ncbi:limonene-1,2-epoxide hydrolase family protein [Mycolicibacter sinensis]|jgi:limonene-1,2-epoxide hydrolase|uniref:Limonene-1,2-epoxide hydrolase n=1 Tax=Mycolicibacter sinensis (strain JDM601) TaxID=875328 RepID=A0A1A2EN35_MYCSD|nr:limonene-1,2-epoxide hydrolase family protein [Mycolicibacter sinensis]OBG06236.1 limonene-1,2-epoxide hydrolase [Mycolicibacter sinensis]OBG07049.1 limonene-1,2-epoxide hydrolase [Mycolicibacter sinensis]